MLVFTWKWSDCFGDGKFWKGCEAVAVEEADIGKGSAVECDLHGLNEATPPRNRLEADSTVNNPCKHRFLRDVVLRVGAHAKKLQRSRRVCNLEFLGSL